MAYSNYLYIALLVITGVSILFVFRWFLRRVEKKRHIAIEDDDYLHAVPTSSPVEEPLQDVQDTRTRSVNFRFSIIRHATTLLIVLLVVFGISIPFLDRIPAAMFSLLVAATGFLLGIAARPFIENLIAGIVITFSRHLRIGDTVEIDNNYGTIEDITPIYTIVKGWDWRRYVIPNADMLSKEFISLTLGDNYRWSYIEFWVAPDTDLAEVKDIAIRVARECPHFAPHEEPSFWVMGMGKEGIRCWLAAWADSPGDAWMLASEMRTGLAEQLRLLKISPHRYHVDMAGNSDGSIRPPGVGSPPAAAGMEAADK